MSRGEVSLNDALLIALLFIMLISWSNSVVKMFESGNISPLPFLPFAIVMALWIIDWIRRRRGRKACLKQSTQ